MRKIKDILRLRYEAGLVRIPAQDERSFWFNVNTCSGRT